MLIKNLPPKIRAVAEKYRLEDEYNGLDSEDLFVAFCWSKTPEGVWFWLACFAGKFEEAIELQPKFKEEKEDKQMSELFGKKYKMTPETSELLQLAVFEAGGDWAYGPAKTIYQNLGFIFVDGQGTMSYAFHNETEYFEHHSLPEDFLEVVKTIKLVQPPPKTELELQLEAILAKIDELKAEAEKLKG